jgi:hypothetical protein
VKLGKSGEEMLEILQNVYGKEPMSWAAVFQWQKHFKDEKKQRVVDEA